MGSGSSIYDYKKFVVALNDMQNYLQASKSNMAKINSISKYIEVLACQDKKEISRVQSEIIKQLFQLTSSFVFELIFYINSIVNEIAHEYIRPSLLTKSVHKSKIKTDDAISPDPISVSVMPNKISMCIHNYALITDYHLAQASLELKGFCDKCKASYSDTLPYSILAKSPTLRIFKTINDSICFICNINQDTNHKIVCPCSCICHIQCLSANIINNFNQPVLINTKCVAHKRIFEQPFIRSIMGESIDILLSMLFFNKRAKTSKFLNRYKEKVCLH
jgi:hypothetical protein